MEFDLIARIRDRCTHRRGDVALGIGDDAALLDVPTGKQLVACTDTLVAGVHFPAATAPEDIGWKSLAVNLSDLAAMGAEPAWALLALTLPDADARFVERFADGFATLADKHAVALIGGDTTQGPLSITVTALGIIPRGMALTRGGARAGDSVFVTGAVGDAAGALKLLLDGRPTPAPLLARLHRPEPRVSAGLALRGTASACSDISDGLLADLGHVCAASGVGAEIDADALPLSSALRAAFVDAACRELALAGGDDYELCFTLPCECEGRVAPALVAAECGATRIGRIVAGSGVHVVDARGNGIETPRAGWEHFAP
ncbi:MAG: thiamine-phosphate kinase [Xanthomonadaceae bacterium]|nr:thiamine-phosphate kinase [Xanthomonadaceae bacterium]